MFIKENGQARYIKEKRKARQQWRRWATACGGGNREKCDLIREHAPHRFGGYFIFVPLFFYINRLWIQTTNFDSTQP